MVCAVKAWCVWPTQGSAYISNNHAWCGALVFFLRFLLPLSYLSSDVTCAIDRWWGSGVSVTHSPTPPILSFWGHASIKRKSLRSKWCKEEEYEALAEHDSPLERPWYVIHNHPGTYHDQDFTIGMRNQYRMALVCARIINGVLIMWRGTLEKDEECKARILLLFCYYVRGI
jgi:hypothetical protein